MAGIFVGVLLVADFFAVAKFVANWAWVGAGEAVFWVVRLAHLAFLASMVFRGCLP